MAQKREQKKVFITIVTNWQSGCGYFFSLLKREATKIFNENMKANIETLYVVINNMLL